MSSEHFPFDSKPFDIATRGFHRINAPNFDKSVDADPTKPGAKRPPSGLARDSGARGPEAFKDSGFLENVTKLLAKIVKGGLFAIPIVGPIIAALNSILAVIVGKDPIDELFKAIGKLISSSVEGALFARYMRSIPSWVPVGRVGYGPSFDYTEDGSARRTNSEEEREIEGIVCGSYGLSNDIVFTQWTHFQHWSFEVRPAAGFRYLVGNGNIPDANEQTFINRLESRSNAPEFREILNIYGQNPGGGTADGGAIECIMDIGAISRPVGDGGTRGLMFDPQWPYWPMTGDHFWASGRWAYDCMRGIPNGKTELFPTQINPIKAFASSRFEGLKFAENEFGVPAARFFFFATSEGGYTEFRSSVDRKKKQHDAGFTLGTRDYEFIVDLPPHDLGRSPYPIGATINFPLNRIVLRPRLLMFVRQAPFDIGGGSRLPFADDLEFVPIEPIIEILRPSDPLKRPSQVRITIPLSKIPAPADPNKKRAVGIDISLGWHDPSGEDARKLFRVRVQVRRPLFFGQSGTVRLASAVNGRWNVLASPVSKASGQPADILPPAPTEPVMHAVEMFLPADASLSVITSGTWHHGFGEFLEENSLSSRRLFVGGVLINVDDDTKKQIQKFIDDARKTINDIRKTASDIKNPKEVLRRELQKKIDELKQSNADQAVIAQLQSQIDALVNDLPEAPDAFKAALGALDSRLNDMLAGLDAVEDFFKITDDLIGERFFPGWHEDIDAAVETGIEESKRVSSIARSMFLRPTPIVNRADEPMGWAELVDAVRAPIGRPLIGQRRTRAAVPPATVQAFIDEQRNSVERGNARSTYRSGFHRGWQRK